MPEVTDLRKVAQYAKSSGAPSDVYNAACRMLDGQIATPFAQRLAELHSVMVWTLRDALPYIEGWTTELTLNQSDAVINAILAAVRDAEIALNGPESHGDGRTPQTLGADEGQATTEAHGAAQ